MHLHRSAWRGLALTALPVVAYLGAASTAAAVTVTFDGPPAVVGASANTVYASSPGVVFNPGIPLPGGEVSCGTLVIASPLAASAPNGARLNCGTGEFPLRPLLHAAFTTRTYRQVSLSVGSAYTRTMQLVGYDSAGQAVAQTAGISIAGGTRQTLSMTAGVSEISTFVLRTLAGPEGSDVVVDDIDLPDPPLAGAPAIQVTRIGGGPVEVPQGFDASAEVALYRVNGSVGAVNWTVTGLPSGVRAPLITPTANGVRLWFTADRTAPPTADPVPMTVTATPVAPGAGSASRSVSIPVAVRPAIEVSAPAEAQAPSCGPAGVTYRIAPHVGPSRWIVDGLPSGVRALINGAPIDAVTPTVDGNPRLAQLTFETTAALPADARVSVGLASQNGLYRSVATLTLRPGTFRATVTPSAGRPPEALQPGTTVTLRGDGICPGLPGGGALRFGNDLALAPFTLSADGRTLTAQVPRLATSGPIGIVPNPNVPAQRIDGPAFRVEGFRERSGFAFPNYTPSITFANMEDAFGARATRISVNSCALFGRSCTIITPIPDPFALAMWGVAAATIGGGDGGVCFGISRTVTQLRRGILDPRSFPPGNASAAFDLTGPGGASPQLIERVNANQLTVMSAEMLASYLAEAAGNALTGTPAGLRARVEEGLRAGRPPALSLRQGGSATMLHVVLAYDVTDAPQGGFHIWVHDSNMPFTTGVQLRGGEAPTNELEPGGMTHRSRMENSRIWVRPDGSWSMPSTGMSAGAGSLGNIVVFDDAANPAVPTLPTAANAASKAFLYLLNTASARSDGAATAAQRDGDGGWEIGEVTAAGRDLLDDGPAIAGAAPRAALWQPAVGVPSDVRGVVLPAGTGPVTVSAAGRGGGTQTQTLLGPGVVASVTAAPDEGALDTATLDPARGAIAFAPGGGARPVGASMTVRSRDGRALSVDVDGRAAEEGLRLGIDPATGGVSLTTDVAGTLALRLSTVSAAGATAVSTRVRVGAGEGVVIPGAAFRSLPQGVRYRTSRGRRGVLPASALRGTAPRVRILSAAVRGRKLVVRARVLTGATGATRVTLLAGRRSGTPTTLTTGVRSAVVQLSMPRPRRGTTLVQVVATRLDTAPGVPVASAGRATRSLRVR